MGGGASPATQVQQTRQSVEPPSYIQPYLQGGIGDLARLYATRGAPAYYPGSTVAAPSADSAAALAALVQRGTAGSPAVAAAQQAVADTASGERLDIAANPWFQGALEAGFAPQTETFTDRVLPALAGQFEGAGRFGSGAHRSAAQMATDSLARAQADAAAQAANAAYQSERDRQLGAAALAPQLAQADYGDIDALLRAGQARDLQAQREIDADIARYNYDQNKDWNYIDRYLASLNAGYPGSQSQGTISGSAQPSTNPFASILGIGQSLASLFSDRRLKEDARPVGALDDGQTVWAYRYRGDPRTRLGLMADEVAQAHPEAVATHPSGYRMVDYGRALPARKTRGGRHG